MSAVGIAAAQAATAAHGPGVYQASALALVATKTTRRPDGSISRCVGWTLPEASASDTAPSVPVPSVMSRHRSTERKAPVCAISRVSSSNVSSQTRIAGAPSTTSARSSERSRGRVKTGTSVPPASAVASTVASTSTASRGPGWRTCRRRRSARGSAAASRIGRGAPNPTSAAGISSPGPESASAPATSLSGPPSGNRRSSPAASSPSWSSAGGGSGLSGGEARSRSGSSPRSATGGAAGSAAGAVRGPARIADSHSTSRISSALRSEPVARPRMRSSITCRSALAARSRRAAPGRRCRARSRR